MLNLKKFENTYTITLEPYAKNIGIRKLLDDLSILGIDADILKEYSREGEYIVKTDIGNIKDFTRLVRYLDYVCHIIHLLYLIEYNSYSDEVIKEIINRSKEVLNIVLRNYGCRDFKVVAKRIYKKFPISSVDICRIVGSELSKYCKVNVQDPDCYIYIEVRENLVFVGYALRESYIKYREVVPYDIINKIIVVVLEPVTIYEYMDLIQLARSLMIKLRIINVSGNTEKMIERACKRLNINIPNNIEIVNLENCVDGVDYVIVLSQYASYGESILREVAYNLLSRGKTMALVLGNEVSDVPLEIRDKAHCEVRLGPMSGHAMRSSVAISYALGTFLNMFTHRLARC